jgi:hypothetical protein
LPEDDADGFDKVKGPYKNRPSDPLKYAISGGAKLGPDAAKFLIRLELKFSVMDLLNMRYEFY